jgi:TolA-binding protein
MRRYLKIIPITIILLSGQMAVAQKSVSSDLGSESYLRANELFAKEKYAAAISLYDSYIESEHGRGDGTITTAEYYAAISAIRLYSGDAEYRTTRFVTNHPESYLKNSIYLEIASQFYQSKNYRKAITYYELCDRLELSDKALPEYYFKLGYSHYMGGDKKRAMLFFSEIMDIDTEYTSPAIYYFSHIAYENEMYLTALDGFMRLKGDESFGSIVPFYIVQIMYIQGDYDGILENAPSLLESAGEDRASELHRIIGDAYFQKGDYASAIISLEKHLEKALRTGREGSYQLAYCYYQTGDYDKSIPLFKEVCTRRDQLSQNAYYLLGDTYIRKGDKKLAQAAFSTAAKMDYDRKIKEEALFNFAKLTYETTYAPFGEVIRAFQEYIEQFPASDHLEEAYDYLVSAYMKVNNYRSALFSLDKISHKDERLERAYQKVAFFRGMELYRNLDLMGANATFDKSLSYGKYDRSIRGRAHYWKGEIWYRYNDYANALAEYQEFLGTPGSSGLEEYNTVRYNIGYIYYNQAKYSEALKWFKNFETNEGYKNQTLLPDLYNRIADCYYIETNYDMAVSYYNKVIERNSTGADYAMFHKGFALGLKHDQRGKEQVLTTLITRFPKSSLVPNAIFERGRAFETLEDTPKAEADFKAIIELHPNSLFVPRAMVQLGLLYFNNGESQKAVTNYKRVIEKYPSTPEARSAMTGLKTTYVEMNEVESYFAYVRTLDGYGDVSSSERDSLLYISGENLYASGNCGRAEPIFRSYLDEFAQGSFRLNASFYLAECLRTSGRLNEAIPYFAEVAQTPNNPFLEQTYVSLSGIYFNQEQFDSAYYYYENLGRVSGSPENTLLARVGVLRSSYEMGDPQRTILSAENLLAMGGLSEEIISEATFMSAKSNYALDRFEIALRDFRKVSKEVTSSEGAESKYRVAELLYKNRSVDEAEKVVYEFIDQNTPHQYWMARVFILLADISMFKNDDFQARATLQSLMDYYQVADDGILDEARAKLSELNARTTTVNDTVRMTIGKNQENQ